MGLQGAVARLQRTGVFRSVIIDMDGGDAGERASRPGPVEEKGLFGVKANLSVNSPSPRRTPRLRFATLWFGRCCRPAAVPAPAGYSSQALLQRPMHSACPLTPRCSLGARTSPLIREADKKENANVCKDDAGQHRLDWTLAFAISCRSGTRRRCTLPSHPGPFSTTAPSRTEKLLAYEFTFDSRDDNAAPKRGDVQHAREVAGLAGGNVYFSCSLNNTCLWARSCSLACLA